MIRETEAERMWHILGMKTASDVDHVRFGFYQGDLFNPQPDVADMEKMTDQIVTHQPDIITVAFDPEGSGPDTHFKVLQVLAESLREEGLSKSLESDPDIRCYRNVWFEFRPDEVNMIVPVESRPIDEMDELFQACFVTQTRAEFPSPDYDGPFSVKCKALQIQQLQTMRKLLGDKYFDSHEDARMRNASGLIHLASYNKREFLEKASDIKKRVVGL